MYYITEIFLLIAGKFRLFQVVSYSLWIVSGRFLLAVGRFRSFLARCRSFQVVSCSLQVVSGDSLLIVGHFRLCQVVSCSRYVVSGHLRLFLARCRLFQFVSCLLQVVSGCFLVVVGCFRSFLACCRLFQVVLRSFLACCRLFQVVSCSWQVVSGHFLLVAGHFRLFHALVSTWLIVKMQPAEVFYIGITLVDVHLNWLHFLILVGGLLVIVIDCMIFLSPFLDVTVIDTMQERLCKRHLKWRLICANCLSFGGFN